MMPLRFQTKQQPAPAPPLVPATAGATSRPSRPKSRRPKSRKQVLAALSPELVFSRPWFISQAAGDVLFFEYLNLLKGGTVNLDLFDDDDDDDFDEDWDNGVPRYETCDGMACLPVRGTLVDSDYAFAYSFATSYAGIAAMYEHAYSRSDVMGILACHDSPGGMASSSLFDTCDMIYEMRGRGSKPMATVSMDSCYSASYLLGSCSDKLFVSRCGGVGSIGAYTQHVDLSKMLADMGVQITLIAAGDKKTDGNSYEPLPDRVKAELQADVDNIRTMFAGAVARNRAVSYDALMATEAGVAMAKDAVPLLADEVGGMDEAIAWLKGKVGAAATVDQPEGNQPGDREGPFTSASGSTGTITYTYTDQTGKLASFTQPFVFKIPSIVDVTNLTPAATDEMTPGVIPSSNVLRLEDAAGAVHTFDDKYAQLLEGETLAVQDEYPKRWQKDFDYRTSLLSGLRAVKAEHPKAFAAVRKLEKRAYVEGDRKVSLLAAPYGGVATLGQIKEVYKPGCFKNGLGGDLRVLWNHADSQMYVLGRTSAGTARFYDTEEGLCAEADAPKTQWAEDLLVSMRRGDVTESSLGFWIAEYEMERRADGMYRVITKAIVHDASVESFAAYEGSTATVVDGQQAAAQRNQARLAIATRRVAVLQLR
jgi:HK97 family phage prohead protease